MRMVRKSSDLKVGDIVVATISALAGNNGRLTKGHQYRITKDGPYNDIISENGTEHICVEVSDRVRFRHLYKNEAKRF